MSIADLADLADLANQASGVRVTCCWNSRMSCMSAVCEAKVRPATAGRGLRRLFSVRVGLIVTPGCSVWLHTASPHFL